MLILDYIIIALALVAFILGIVKGFLTPIVNLAGFFVVLYAGGAFSSILYPLFTKIIADENICSIASTIVSMLLVWLIYFLVTHLILKIITKSKLIGFANRMIGGLLGIVIIYLIVSIVTAFMQNDNTLFASIREQYGEAFNKSWIVQNIYKSNPIGEGLVNTAFKKLIELLEGALIAPQA